MLGVTDLERSVAFYENLGLHQIVADADYARFEVPEGGSTLSLDLVDEPAEPGNVSVYFESDDLDSLVGELQRRGVAFESPPEDKDYLWREAVLRDPDGHRIILFHAGENRLDPPWKLT